MKITENNRDFCATVISNSKQTDGMRESAFEKLEVINEEKRKKEEEEQIIKCNGYSITGGYDIAVII